jgi:hypothetical protein
MIKSIPSTLRVISLELSAVEFLAVVSMNPFPKSNLIQSEEVSALSVVF